MRPFVPFSCLLPSRWFHLLLWFTSKAVQKLASTYQHFGDNCIERSIMKWSPSALQNLQLIHSTDEVAKSGPCWSNLSWSNWSQPNSVADSLWGLSWTPLRTRFTNSHQLNHFPCELVDKCKYVNISAKLTHFPISCPANIRQDLSCVWQMPHQLSQITSRPPCMQISKSGNLLSAQFHGFGFIMLFLFHGQIDINYIWALLILYILPATTSNKKYMFTQFYGLFPEIYPGTSLLALTLCLSTHLLLPFCSHHQNLHISLSLHLWAQSSTEGTPGVSSKLGPK